MYKRQGVDPIVTAAQVVLGLQTVISRTQDITREPAVVTIGAIKGGVRENIIPDSVEMRGTIRTFNEAMRDDIHERVTTLAESVARGSRAGCTVCINKNYPVTVNDPALTEAMLPTLQRVAGEHAVELVPKVTGSEDFSFYQRLVPGLFYFVTTPFRMTPWFMLAAVILVPIGLTDRHRRRQFLTIVVFIVTTVTVLTLTPKKIDRYIIEIVPLLAIAVGIGAARLVDLLRTGRIGAIGTASARRYPQALSIAAVAALIAATGYSIHVSPWGGIYFNPLLGGSDRAEALLVVGWGEGIRDAGDIIAEREAGACDDIMVAMAFPYFDQAITCGRATQTGNPADYRIIYINDRQLDLYGKVAEFRANNTPVGVVEERGIVLAEVYDLRPAA